MAFIATAVTGIASIAGSLIQGDAQRSATNKAAGKAQAATDAAGALSQQRYDEAAQLSQKRYDEGMALLQPYIGAGTSGLNTFMALGGFVNPSTGAPPPTYEQYLATVPKQEPVQSIATKPNIVDVNKLSNAEVAKLAGYKLTLGKQIKGVSKSSEALAKSLPPALVKSLRQQIDQKQQQQLQEWNNQNPPQPAVTPLTREQYAAQQQAQQQQVAQQQQQDMRTAQQQQLQNIQDSPTFNALVKQQEDALLQNSAATGGVRNGNTAGALAYLRPNLLQGQIDKQMAYAQALSSAGQNAAGMGAQLGANQANALGQLGQNQAVTQGNYLVNNGDTQASAQLKLGQIQSNTIGGISNAFSSAFAGNPLGGFGGQGGITNTGLTQAAGSTVANNFGGNGNFLLRGLGG